MITYMYIDVYIYIYILEYQRIIKKSHLLNGGINIFIILNTYFYRK